MGTCRMRLDAERSVVRPLKLNVHSVEGLRVIHCPIFPNLPGGNTNVPTIAVADTAADIMINAA